MNSTNATRWCSFIRHTCTGLSRSRACLPS
jgi:hypothetical protein